MCTGAILLYKIPRVVIGENQNFVGGEKLLKEHGVEVRVVDDTECKELMKRFINEKPEVGRFHFYTRKLRSLRSKSRRNGMRISANYSAHKLLDVYPPAVSLARQTWLSKPSGYGAGIVAVTTSPKPPSSTSQRLRSTTPELDIFTWTCNFVFPSTTCRGGSVNDER